MTALGYKLNQYFAICSPYFQANRIAVLWLSILVAMTVIISIVYVGFSYVQRDILNALSERNQNKFFEGLGKYLLVLIIAVPIAVMRNYFSRKLSLHWRESLTNYILKKYYSSLSFVKLEQLYSNIDNPDQRICNDVNTFTTTSLTFFTIVFEAIINLLLFSYVLFTIFPTLYAAVLIYALAGTVITLLIGRKLGSQFYDKAQKEADLRYGIIRTKEYSESIAFYDSDACLDKQRVNNLFQLVVDIQKQIISTQLHVEIFSKSYDYFAFIVPSLIIAPIYFGGAIDLGAMTQSSDAFFNIRSDFSILINYYEDLSLFSACIDRLYELLTALDKMNSSDDELNVGRSPSDLQEKTNGYKPLNYDENSHEVLFHSTGNGMNVPLISLNKNTLKPPSYLNSDDVSLFSPQNTYQSSSSSNYSSNYTIKYSFSMSNIIDKSVLLQCRGLSLLPPDKSSWILGSSTQSNNVNNNGDHIKYITFTLRFGDRILITGPSGCGKSSFFRVISGVWTSGCGSVAWSGVCPNLIHQMCCRDSSSIDETRVMFIPQRPYNGTGTLRQEITYPMKSSSSSPVDDDYLLELLSLVNLRHVAAREGDGDPSAGLCTQRDWGRILSQGEQQRLAFSRILFMRPDVVFLDESTSALDKESEGVMYNLLLERSITYVSIGHSDSLREYHTTVFNMSTNEIDMIGATYLGLSRHIRRIMKSSQKFMVTSL